MCRVETFAMLSPSLTSLKLPSSDATLESNFEGSGQLLSVSGSLHLHLIRHEVTFGSLNCGEETFASGTEVGLLLGYSPPQDVMSL
jgi:hypothetical protein